MKAVYLDNNATTAVAPEVLEVMLPFLKDRYGNPSSMHTFGGAVAHDIRKAREQVAALIGAEPDEIIFTSCGTESDDTAIRSGLESDPGKRHIVTTRVEHPAVHSFCRWLADHGYRVTEISVNSEGLLDLAEVEAALAPDTAIVTVMHANNETGVLFPIERIAEMCRERGILFHTDAVQSVGKLPLDLRRNGGGHALAQRAQTARAEGRRRAVRPQGHAVHAVHDRRPPGARTPRGHGERRLHRRRSARRPNWRRARWPTRTRASPPCATGSKRNSSRASPTRAATATRNSACRTPATSPSNSSRAKRSCCCSTRPASAPRPAPPAPPARSNPRTSCAPWACPFTFAHGSIRMSLSRYNTDADVDAVIATLPGIIQRLRSISPFTREHPAAGG